MSKSVLITGATRGLGQGMARHFAQRGYKLALTARKQEDLIELKTELEASSPQVIICELDVSQFDRVPVVLREAAAALGGLDIVVANAGLGEPARAGEGKFQQMAQMIDVNLTGAIATADAAIELFREQGRGQFVGITSVAAVRGMPNSGVYSATKAALGKYLEALRCEVHGQNIVVTELAPGYIDTDINRALASRPFLVTAAAGTRVMVDLIEKQVSFRYVPPWPWTLVAQAMKLMPSALLRKM
ncbi:SDR family oxidoreductase [Pseudohalioglobus sediminis]|uniref:SDR family oxidoreductase n=1 Tax=Pseudohalioglobus sediminis TaxID=2606449 RepID=A0A5B0X1C7_9GAMM|nr:SDR family oxidoreductase [Pseudohalioglobus sediminis]KAA1193083.1 SDR family oxidoreductase [Pseudohalioglobus sediminis]